jgi:hypothetical protein
VVKNIINTAVVRESIQERLDCFFHLLHEKRLAQNQKSTKVLESPMRNSQHGRNVNITTPTVNQIAAKISR